MSIRHDIAVLTTHIVARAEGSYDHVDAVQVFADALTAATAHRKLEVLIDARKVLGNPSILQRFEFAEAIAKLYGEIPDNSAALTVMVGNEPMIHPERFGETVAVNRWVPLKVTTDMQEALD